ncbi:MAG: hypothetical protein Q9186_001425 [Xanthomendoza sp. 1 TL-2023]
MSHFNRGSASERQLFVTQLLDSLTQHGFVKLVGHGIHNSTVAELFEWSRKFFQIQADDKLAIAHPEGSEPQRGWSAVGKESSSALYRKGLLKSQMTEELKDAREHFDQGSKTDHQFPTRWPEEHILPGFKKSMEEAFEQLEEVATQIMAALEVAFGIPPGGFVKSISNESNASEMRLNHYPAIDVEEIMRGKVSRIWPHFDLGVITLLFQDSVGGLEFEDRRQRDTFQRIECSNSSEMVVNVSETLQRWTNGSLRAGLHRVNGPPNLEGKESGMLLERYSIAYFCKADRSASVGPLKHFAPTIDQQRYEQISALDYHLQRLQSAY